MKNQTTVTWLQDLATDTVDQCILYYEIILISVIALIALRRGRKFWLNIISIWIFVEALTAMIAPAKMLKVITDGTPDNVHLLLTQSVGLLMLFWCIGYWLLRGSTDSTVQTSLLWATTIQAGCTLLAFAYLISHPTKKSSPVRLNESLVSPFFSSLIFLVITAYFTFKSTDWGGYSETSSHSNLHLRADFVFLMVIGVLVYALPQWIIRISLDVNKMDALHTYLARVAGTLLISMAVMSGRSANFLRPSDKDANMLSHWMYFVSSALIGIYYMYVKRSEMTWQRMGLQAGYDVVLIMNATGALNIDPSVFTKVLVPRVKGLFKDCTSVFKLKQY